METTREYSLERYLSAKTPGFAEALALYAAHIPRKCRTSTNEITHWVDHLGEISADVESWCCGLTVNGRVAGFAHWAALRSHSVGFLDYIVVAPEERTPDVLSNFFALLADAAAATGIRQILTEVVDDPVGVRFCRLQGFREIRAPYLQPPLGRQSPDALPSSLMVLGLEGNELQTADYLRWIHAAYFDYYAAWSRPFQSSLEAAQYWMALEALEAQIKAGVATPKIPVKGGGIERLVERAFAWQGNGQLNGTTI